MEAEGRLMFALKNGARAEGGTVSHDARIASPGFPQSRTTRQTRSNKRVRASCSWGQIRPRENPQDRL